MRTRAKTAGAVLTLVLVLAGTVGCSSRHHAHQASPTSSGAGGASVASSSPAHPGSSTQAAGPSAMADSGPSGGVVPRGFVPTSASFDSATHGWVLGTAPCKNPVCTSIVRTRDGGRTWAGIPAPQATLGDTRSSRDGGVSLIRFADDRDGWAGVGDLYSTHDGGASWHRQTLAAFKGRVLGLGTGGGYVFASVFNCPSQGGQDCSQTSQVYASPVSRDAWRAVSPVISGGGQVPALIVQGGTWFLPTRNAIWRGTGTGGARRIANPCAKNSALGGFAAASGVYLDALCVGNGAAGSAQYQLYGTGNGGSSWQIAGRPHVGPSGVAGIADSGKGVLIVAAQSGASVVLRTADDGASWGSSSISAPSGGLMWTDLGFTTAEQAFVVLGGQSMYLSRDAGVHFAAVSF